MATKFVCDICGSESDAMHKYQLPYPKEVYATDSKGTKLIRFETDFYAKNVDMCAACEQTIYSLVRYINKNVV